MTKRQKALLKRRLFLGGCAILLALIIALVVFIINAIVGNNEGNSSNVSSDVLSIASSDTSSLESEALSSEVESKPEMVTRGEFTLDANFECLLLVNGDNPLPDTYDSEIRQYLVEIDPQYRNNNYVTQIHEDVYPFITAMVANAQKDGVNLKVWSPFRSYAIQKDLFQKQVDRVGGDEDKAATVVARPGTSEHNTGLCADFNMASDAFENTEMYKWMEENAADYGFIMRYSAEKQSLTGVIHESWHWRFVGINHAQKIKTLGVCLEEYVELLGIDNNQCLNDTLKITD